MSSGVVSECSCSKWVWSAVSMIWGSDVISFIVGSLIVLRLGWSLALGSIPAIIFRLWWYLLALFLYWLSPFLRRVYVNMLLALLLMIVAIALLHSDGMSSMLGESGSCSIFAACGMGGVSRGADGESAGRWDLAYC